MSQEAAQAIRQKIRPLFVVALIDRAAQSVWAAAMDLPNSLPNMIGGGIGFTTDYAVATTASAA
ncbi:hypothetical protein PQQ51_09060 [Paraburkholderia xenovorans]|uniref:hypothetical protein n=1 Tax=Paraburkholderia xenovorans TaxID=36873 RepID=UPI0038B9921D